MGKEWDGGDIAMRPETWAMVLRVLKPGAHLLAFGGTRTHHRVMCAIEDAGFELRDTLMWVFGSGFPKAQLWSQKKADAGNAEAARMIEAGFEGWARGGLKPAWEPIILARKPTEGTIGENVLINGCGAVNVDGCRVVGDKGSGQWGSSNETVDRQRMFNASPADADFRSKAVEDEAGKVGRWPANVIHDGSPEVVRLFPAEAGAFAPVRRRQADKTRNSYGAFKGDIDESGSTYRGDSGSAARFFYCPKATQLDRNEGLVGFKPGTLRWSSGAESPGGFQNAEMRRNKQNTHPTVKPVDLMRWLVRLVTPPGGHVLDLFEGSGGTGKACALEGFDFTGVDRESEYVEIARARSEHALRIAGRAV